MSYPKHNKKTGYWEFCIEVRYNGKRRQIRRNRIRSRREAVLLYEQLNKKVMLLMNKQDAQLTVKGFLYDWIEKERKFQCEAVTLYNNRCSMEKHIIPRIGDMLLSELQLIHCQFIVSDMIEKGYERNTIERTLSLLRLALNRAVSYSYIEKNPTIGVKLPKKVKKEKRIWTLEQVKTFLLVTKGERFYCAYALALLTGMRMGEILGLRWSDVDFERKVIRIKQTVVNYGKELKKGAKTYAGIREISMPEQLCIILQEEKARHAQFLRSKQLNSSNDDLVVYNKKNGKHIFPANLALSFAKSVKESGLPAITFHSMRHTHATILLEHNMNIKLISARLGHTKIGITLDTYSHVTSHMQYAVAQKLDELLNHNE